MTEPTWVLEEVALAIHARSVEEFGGAPGVRDAGLFSSAMARPRNLFAYTGGSATIAALAAAYAFGIARNHPFVDGNKRTSLLVCLLFLRLNDQILEATQEEKFESFHRLAAGLLEEPALAAWIEHRLRPVRR